MSCGVKLLLKAKQRKPQIKIMFQEKWEKGRLVRASEVRIVQGHLKLRKKSAHLLLRMW